MNNNIMVRSLLVDKDTGKYIKAVDERTLSDFIPLFTKVSEQKIILFDFKLVIDYYHNEIENKLKQRENIELAIKRKTVFNLWMKSKTITQKDFLLQMCTQVIRDSEELLNWIHTNCLNLKQDI